ncbi:MAG: PH domain-containing protein [Deltaproteobacteria bacterium]|nr:PH domain-containing protein [Nannocystaceae bacterium]
MNREEVELDTPSGLPEELPDGEHIVWQGRPQWRALARHGFKVRWLAVYFAVFVVARVVSMVSTEQWLTGAVQLAAMVAVFGACLGLCMLLAALQARSSLYTITTRRVVMRMGVALPITWNLPFERIAAADLVVRDEGDGDIVLRLTGKDRVAWFHFWPHARRGQGLRACPSLRAIAEPAAVAERMGVVFRAWAQAHASQVVAADASGAAVPAATHVTDRAIGTPLTADASS